MPPKEAFYSELNLENITDKDYEHVQKVWEAFEIKNLGKYHDLYVQCDTFLLANVFENFRNKCIEIYGLDPAHFFVCTRISMASMFKKDKSKIRIFFSIWVFFHEHSRNTGLQGKGEGISLTPHYHFHPLHRQLDISVAITAERSPLYIASSRTRTGNLWFPSASH